MSQFTKIMGAAGLLTGLLTFLLALAGVVSTDSYSLAAQAQANGDLALMDLAGKAAGLAHGESRAGAFAEPGDGQKVNQ